MMPVGILAHGRRRPRPGARPRARAVALDWGIFSQHIRGEFTQQLQSRVKHAQECQNRHSWMEHPKAACVGVPG
jgi:hypothetical protein